MASATVRRRERTASDTFTSTLTQAGYTRQQARQLMDALLVMRGGRGVFGHEQLDAIIRLPEDLQRDMWRMLDAWNEVAGGKVELRELDTNQMEQIVQRGAAFTREDLDVRLRTSDFGPPHYRIHLPGDHTLYPSAIRLFDMMYEQMRPSHPRMSVPRRLPKRR